MLIGFIGAGNIGSQLARLAIKNGHNVVLSNSRAPETLSALVDELGPMAGAAWPAEVAAAADVAVVAIPFNLYDEVPVDGLRGKVVIDTGNYYPERRDGFIPELDQELTTTAEILQHRLADSFVVKAFNHIGAGELASDGRPSGSSGRRALAIAGDHEESKRTVADLIDSFEFDTVDVGRLSEGWRYQRDTLAYHGYQTVQELGVSLAGAKRYRDISEPQRTAP